MNKQLFSAVFWFFYCYKHMKIPIWITPQENKYISSNIWRKNMLLDYNKGKKCNSACVYQDVWGEYVCSVLGLQVCKSIRVKTHLGPPQRGSTHLQSQIKQVFCHFIVSFRHTKAQSIRTESRIPLKENYLL